MRKPNPAIYHHALELLGGVPPPQAVFLDDSPATWSAPSAPAARPSSSRTPRPPSRRSTPSSPADARTVAMRARLAAHPRAGDAALVVAAICFGSTFLIVQDAVELVEPIPFLAVRFLFGAVVLAPLARRRPASPGEVRDGVLAGVALVVGYVLQTVGLQYTGSATSAFITYLLVVFVPVLAFVVLRRRPHPVTLVGIAVAVVGARAAHRPRW